jgi:arylsulfatase A-like enzyme
MSAQSSSPPVRKGRIALNLLASMALLACAEAPAIPPNLILISIDTLRADHLGIYGYERDTSPNLDAFARRGVVFENALAPSAWTLPSHATMLTGLAPLRHGAVGSRFEIREDVPVLAERLREAGYRTAAVVNGPFVGERFGFDRGFASFHYVDPVEVAGHQRQVMATLRAAQAPFFLFLHYMSVHQPYEPGDAFDLYSRPGAPHPEGEGNLRTLKAALRAGKRQLDAAELASLRDRYDGEIRSVDSRLAEIFEALGDRLDRNTVLMVTADHGEEFLEHGDLGHNGTLYRELLHVPLLLRGPGVPGGGRIATLVGLVDVMPTLLDFAGVPVPDAVEGISLRDLWQQGADPERHLDLVTGYPFDGEEFLKVGVRTRNLKLIVDLRAGTREIYDLSRDPDERRNLYGLHARGAELMRLIPGIPVLSEAPPDEAVPPEERQQLRDLGYLD